MYTIYEKVVLGHVNLEKFDHIDHFITLSVMSSEKSFVFGQITFLQTLATNLSRQKNEKNLVSERSIHFLLKDRLLTEERTVFGCATYIPNLNL
jgi:hypothetical protein